VAGWLAEGARSGSTADASAADDTSGGAGSGMPFISVLASLGDHRHDASPVYDGPDGTLSWADLDARSSVGARSFQDVGLRPGDRVSVLVPPSRDLLIVAGSIWKAGGVPVVADASAGVRQLRRLVRAAAPRFVVGTRATLAAAVVLRFAPGATRVSVEPSPGAIALEPTGSEGATHTPVPVGPHDVAAIVHTSGATGPAKAVRYTHGALAAQRDVVGPLFGMRPGDAFTTSFGPFMLLAPSLQMTCVRPDFPIDRPSALGFDQLHAATARAHVTVAWLSPASARRILATAHGRTTPIRMVMLAGAPIPPDMVAGVRAVTGGSA
jgi:acyl-CoA synthetase (AMP-forming)/AMP-acid ligase II